MFRVHDGRVLGAAYNGLPRGECDGSEHCRTMCSIRCQHAEQRAVRRAYGSLASVMMCAYDSDISEAVCDVLHVKVTVKGSLTTLQPSGPPSCALCSGAMLDSGISHVWLYRHEQDDDTVRWWQRYPIAEFHELSLQNHIERSRRQLRV